MAIFAALALFGAAASTVGKLQAQKEERALGKIHEREVEIQKQANQNIFNITFPNFQQQNRAVSGLLSSSLARGGVAVGEGSALTQLSEQARINSLNESLTLFQFQLSQRSLDVEKVLNKRSISQSKVNSFFTLASGVGGAATDFKQAGGTFSFASGFGSTTLQSKFIQSPSTAGILGSSSFNFSKNPNKGIGDNFL